MPETNEEDHNHGESYDYPGELGEHIKALVKYAKEHAKELTPSDAALDSLVSDSKTMLRSIYDNVRLATLLLASDTGETWPVIPQGLDRLDTIDALLHLSESNFAQLLRGLRACLEAQGPDDGDELATDLSATAAKVPNLDAPIMGQCAYTTPDDGAPKTRCHLAKHHTGEHCVVPQEDDDACPEMACPSNSDAPQGVDEIQ